MSVRYDPLLAEALAREIGDRLRGARADALRMDRERRVARLRFRDAPPLWFLLHPEDGHVLHGLEGDLAGPETGFRKLFLDAVLVPPDERLLLLTLADGRGRPRHRVAVELHTNQHNLLLLDAAEEGEDDRIRAALWPRETRHRELRAGQPYRPPAGSREGTEEPVSVERWRALLADVDPPARRGTLLRSVAYTSALNADWILGAASAAEGGEGDPVAGAHGRYLSLRAGWRGGAATEGAGGPGAEAGRASGGDGPGADAGPAGWLLRFEHGLQPYVARLDRPDAAPLDALLDGMRRAAEEAGSLARLEGPPAGRAGPDPDVTAAEAEEERAALRRALHARRKRARRRLAALRRELEAGPEPEALRHAGNLLLARLGDVPRGASRAVLRDFDGSEREVELDPARKPSENAEAYFDEAARVERAREKVPREIARAERAIRAAEEALERLEAEGASEELWEAAGGRPAAGDEPGDGAEERLPYHRYRSSGGREIRVGRGARHNDDLTFHHSSPEDVWLHARQVAGAHVILRWGRREGNPPRRELIEAAVAAAVHSGGRHSGTVAVDWTRRKYVRKPRKAPPGAVVPERVQTLFVEPDEALLARLREDG